MYTQEGLPGCNFQDCSKCRIVEADFQYLVKGFEPLIEQFELQLL